MRHSRRIRIIKSHTKRRKNHTENENLIFEIFKGNKIHLKYKEMVKKKGRK